jgi:hypothetical protein
MGIAIEQLLKKDMIVCYHYDDKADELIKEPFDMVNIRTCTYNEDIDLSKVF